MVVLVDDTFLLKTSGDLSTLNENDVFQLPGMWIYECSGLTQNSNHSAQQLFMDDNSIAEKVIASDQTESRVPIEDAFNNISKNSNEEIFSFLDRVFDVGTQPSILINICKVLFEHKSQNENDSWLKKTKYTQFYETTNLEVGAKKVMGISTDEVLILYDFCRKLFYEGQVSQSAYFVPLLCINTDDIRCYL